MEWKCTNCGRKNNVDHERCACGYDATQYDLAASSEDTGQYLVNRISVPSIETLIEKQMTVYIKISKIIAISILSGIIVLSITIAILKFLYR